MAKKEQKTEASGFAVEEKPEEPSMPSMPLPSALDHIAAHLRTAQHGLTVSRRAVPIAHGIIYHEDAPDFETVVSSLYEVVKTLENLSEAVPAAPLRSSCHDLLSRVDTFLGEEHALASEVQESLDKLGVTDDEPNEEAVHHVTAQFQDRFTQHTAHVSDFRDHFAKTILPAFQAIDEQYPKRVLFFRKKRL